MARPPRREKVSITIDPALLQAVDLYVLQHKDLDRSKVMDAALGQWYAARQDEAMIEQFAEPSAENQAEQLAWKRIRRAATTRRVNRARR
jgi:hypothetical protein